MKTKTKATLAALALGASAWFLVAQDNGGQTPGGPGNPGPGQRRRPMVPLVVRALDANHDGFVDAEEIANAPAVLKTLDKDGDGKLSLQELMGPPPPGRGGMPGNGPGPGDGNERPPGPPPADQ